MRPSKETWSTRFWDILCLDDPLLLPGKQLTTNQILEGIWGLTGIVKSCENPAETPRKDNVGRQMQDWAHAHGLLKEPACAWLDARFAEQVTALHCAHIQVEQETPGRPGRRPKKALKLFRDALPEVPRAPPPPPPSLLREKQPRRVG